MTTDQKIDALSESMRALGDKMDKRFDEHDQKFTDLGELYVGLSYKLDMVIRQTADLPVIRDNIEYLMVKVAPIENNFKKIDEQLIKTEAKDDYMLSFIEKISAREYA